MYETIRLTSLTRRCGASFLAVRSWVQPRALRASRIRDVKVMKMLSPLPMWASAIDAAVEPLLVRVTVGGGAASSSTCQNS